MSECLVSLGELEIFHGQLGAGNMERSAKNLMSAELGQCSELLTSLDGNLFTEEYSMR